MFSGGSTDKDLLARSNIVSVKEDFAPGIRLRPLEAAAGKDVYVSFGGVKAEDNEWIALAGVTDPSHKYSALRYLKGQKEGTFRFQAPWDEGTYEIRLFGRAVEGQYPFLMRSNQIRVTKKKKGPASASSFDPQTGETTKSRLNDDGTRTITREDSDGNISEAEDPFDPAVTEMKE